MSLKKITSSFWAILAVVSLSLLNISCSDTETTDSTNFVIYYTGMTDIGPSMVGTISQPTYKGNTPSDFAISSITLNGEPYSGDCFEIDSETGKISVQNTKNASTGRYSISISCVSGGKTYNFPDIVVVKLLAAAPEGVVVTPNLLKADYGDIIDINSIADMPTAMVTTEGEHISITSYKIGAVELVTNEEGASAPSYQPLDEEYNKCFTISTDGEFSIAQGEVSEKLEPAIYSISLILGTKVEETMLERAVMFQVTSKPLELIYSNNYGKIEEKTNEDPTTFKSVVPSFKGSTDGLTFSIYSVSPSTDKIKINEKNGQIYVEDGHGFKKGEIYTISVCARNMYNTEEEVGKIFNDIYTLETVDFIKPITKFSYTEDGNNKIKKVELARYTIVPEIEGDEVLYKFSNVPDELKNSGVTFNENDGSISAIKGNKVAKGTYTFSVTAENTKGPKTIEVTLEIIDNPNKFTYIHYGNNLGADGAELEGDIYQNQFRFYSNQFSSYFPTPTTDYNGDATDLKWSAEMIRFLEPAGGYPKANGQIRFKNWKDNQVGILLVTATAGDDPDTQVTVSVPVFVHMLKSPVYQIEYTPFVLHVNPKVGGTSTSPKITTKGADLTEEQRSMFLLDYRRTFLYYNFGGKRSDGTFHEDGRPDADPISPFMQNLWDKCGAGFGTKTPLSYYNGTTAKTDWSKTLGYVDNSNDKNKRHTVNILANQWNDDGWANGFLVGAMTYTETGDISKLNGGTEIAPFIVWFDENYEEQK
ncbi:surface glycan-binding family protein [Bacteroides acidifaciens]|uniref:surface glycan-binding family protein n=1 Tax=Bacteroides acidifaciens TaxID=85831 RepID=UPI00158D8095|nr:surface glycan-binding family protein [Bacteroides acidifaciens]